MNNYYKKCNKTLCKLIIYYIPSYFNTFQDKKNSNKTLNYYVNHFPLQCSKYILNPYSSPFLKSMHLLHKRSIS